MKLLHSSRKTNFLSKKKWDKFKLFRICKNKEKSLNSCEQTNEKRAHWANQLEFILTCIGYSVGLGNLWRFPYLCMQQGGGAFLVPYLTFLFICGVPLFFMETAIGQSTGLSTVRIFKMVPFFSGLGWCMVVASGILSIYYNLIIAWVLYFFGMSFQWNVPWSHCDNWWNTKNCFIYTENYTHTIDKYITNSTNLKSAAEEFWLHNVLELSESIEVLGGVHWKLLLALIAAWILTFVCMCKGIRSSGKIVYVTALAPYVLLTIILIRGVTLPGSWTGLKFYIVPNWKKLLEIEVWVTAATQIFYSLGPGWGGLITFGSFNRLNHNVMRDAIFIPVVCGLTSIYGGFAIFSVIGHLMHITGQTETTQLIKQGPGLAFIAYPQALAKLPGSAIWSVLFFLTLLTLGLDSQFATLEAVITGLSDNFPNSFGKHKVLFTLGVCVVEFFLGFILVTRAGLYYFNLLDTYATAFSIVVIVVLESIVIAYLYGAKRLVHDIEGMIGKMKCFTKYWWMINWYGFVPLMTLCLLISTIVSQSRNSYKVAKQYPTWALIIGWTVACISIILFPIFSVIAIVRYRHKWKELFKPSTEWKHLVDKRKEIYLKGTMTTRL